MKKILKFVSRFLLVVNLLTAILLVCCAYSPMLPAAKMPLLSLAGLAFPFVLAVNVLFLVFWLIAYWRYAFVSLVTFLICFVQIRAFFPINAIGQFPPKNSLKVLSYNILSSNITSSNTNKGNATIAYLEAADADIICLQELQFATLKKHKELLKKYPYKSYNLSNDSQAAAHHLACLSKYPIIDSKKIELKSTSNGCTKYHILYEGDTIVVYNCHLQSNGLQKEDKSTYKLLLTNPLEYLDNKGTEDTKTLIKKLRDSAAKRAAQADVILADMEKETSPYIIVCGDFNDSPISYTCHRLKEQLDDAYIGSGNGPGISYNRHGMYYRIDHILHSPQFKAYGCTVDRSIKISDHYPIFCFLEKR